VDEHGKVAVRKKLAEIPGIGPITASALVASIGDARKFECQDIIVNKIRKFQKAFNFLNKSKSFLTSKNNLCTNLKFKNQDACQLQFDEIHSYKYINT
jgi:Transposase IS116/IS110/IS902 family